MNKMKKSRKLLVVLLALSMIIAVFPLTAFAGVTDTGDGSIIRTTTTNYYTTVKIEGTFIAAGATTPETFTDSSAEITGNTGDADVQTEINRLKEAFRNWAGEKNATEINFDTLLDFLNGLSDEQQRAALLHLSVKLAEKQGGGAHGRA